MKRRRSLVNVDKIISLRDRRTFKFIFDKHIKIEGECKPLWKIIDNDDVFMLRIFLTKYRENIPKLKYITKILIFYAIKCHSNDCAIYLLANIEDVNELITKFCNTYLQTSTEYNNYRVSEYLLESRKAISNSMTTNFHFPIGNALKNKNRTNGRPSFKTQHKSSYASIQTQRGL